MRLLICGDREWDGRADIRNAIERLRPAVVIEGEARGADRMAREEAEALGVEVLRYPADWERYGRAAGPIRNTEMLVQGRPTHVLAFHHNIAKSKGTANMLAQARRDGVPCAVVAHSGQPVVFQESGFFGREA